MIAQSRGGSSMPLLLTAVLVAIAAFMIVTFASTIPIATNNQVSDHGIAKHPEAKAIEDSCNKSIYQVWRDKRESKYYFICKLENDKWGIIPVVMTSGGTQIWKTAFSPGSGCWADTLKYVSAFGTRYGGKIQ
jgi:hypothetical protein